MNNKTAFYLYLLIPACVFSQESSIYGMWKCSEIRESCIEISFPDIDEYMPLYPEDSDSRRIWEELVWDHWFKDSDVIEFDTRIYDHDSDFFILQINRGDSDYSGTGVLDGMPFTWTRDSVNSELKVSGLDEVFGDFNVIEYSIRGGSGQFSFQAKKLDNDNSSLHYSKPSLMLMELSFIGELAEEED